jgi:uncharacterized glyoxalase superfamily protein PhnB
MAKKAKKAVKKAKKATKTTKRTVKKAVRQAKRSAGKLVKKAAKAVKAVKKAAKAVAKQAKPIAPKGLVSVAPGFTANDARASIAWYCDVLGFTVVEKWEHEGEFRGARIGHGAVLINIGQDDWKMGRDRVKGQGTRMYFSTNQDIDKYAEEITSRGGVINDGPRSGWGLRVFSIDDPDGYKLTFMTPEK